MRFFDRKAELEEIELLDKKKPSFLVITGRRRVGKTELILHFLSKEQILHTSLSMIKRMSCCL